MALVKLNVIKINKSTLKVHTPQGFVCDLIGKAAVSSDGLYTEFEYPSNKPIPTLYSVNQTLAQIEQLCCNVDASEVGSGV